MHNGCGDENDSSRSLLRGVAHRCTDEQARVCGRGLGNHAIRRYAAWCGLGTATPNAGSDHSFHLDDRSRRPRDTPATESTRRPLRAFAFAMSNHSTEPEDTLTPLTIVILAHADPAHLKRLVSALPDTPVVLHCDARTSAR